MTSFGQERTSCRNPPQKAKPRTRLPLSKPLPLLGTSFVVELNRHDVVVSPVVSELFATLTWPWKTQFITTHLGISCFTDLEEARAVREEQSQKFHRRTETRSSSWSSPRLIPELCCNHYEPKNETASWESSVRWWHQQQVFEESFVLSLDSCFSRSSILWNQRRKNRFWIIFF